MSSVVLLSYIHFDFLFYRTRGRGVRGSLKLVLAVCLGQVPCPSGRGFTSLFQWLALRCCSRLHLLFIRFYYFVFTSCHYCVVLELVKSKKKKTHITANAHILYTQFFFFTILFYFYFILQYRMKEHVSGILNEAFSVLFRTWCRNLKSSDIKSKSEITVDGWKIFSSNFAQFSGLFVAFIVCSYRCINFDFCDWCSILLKLFLTLWCDCLLVRWFVNLLIWRPGETDGPFFN